MRRTRKRKEPKPRGPRPASGRRPQGKKVRPAPAAHEADLPARAQAGDREAFLALVRFHSTFNPLPLTRDLLLASGLDEETRARIAGRLKRREDHFLMPFPRVNMMFWGEEWVQRLLERFLWKRTRKGGRPVPDEAFLKRLWEATREGAALQLRIYKKATVTAAEWVRVKYPHFADLGLSEAQMLKVARAEGCRFGEQAFLAAVRRFFPKRGA